MGITLVSLDKFYTDLPKQKDFFYILKPNNYAMNLINLPKSHEIVKEQDLHKSVARGLFTLDGQIEIQGQNILEQIELLQKQALEIQEKRRISKIIYQSEIKFDPVILGIYYLYIVNDTRQFISMVGPNEWGRSLRNKLSFVAKIRLQYDHTWEILELNIKNYFYEQL